MKINGKWVFLSVTLSAILILVLGFISFVTSIRNQRTCEWANIDNIELHARIDIPRVVFSNCISNPETNTKMAYFKLDEINLDEEKYLQKHKLAKIHETTEIDYAKFIDLNADSMPNSELYYRKNLINDEASYVLFDKVNSKLWVTIEYKD